MIYKCFDEKFSKNWKRLFFIYFSMRKFKPPTVASPYPRGSWFEQILKYTTCLHTSFGFSGQMVYEKKNFKKQWFLLFFKFLIIFPSKRTWLIRITRHAVNQGSKFEINKICQGYFFFSKDYEICAYFIWNQIILKLFWCKK